MSDEVTKPDVMIGISDTDKAKLADGTVILTGLSKQEMANVQAGINKALAAPGDESPVEQALASAFRKILLFGATMITVAGVLWVVVFILSNLPGQ